MPLTLRSNRSECPPALLRELLRAQIANLQPAVLFQLDTDLFLVNLRNPGEELPQDHLGCIRTTSSRCWRDQKIRNCWHKWQVPWQWGDIPEDILDIIRLGRTALQKPDDGIRGIVVGHVLRRLVARTIAVCMPERVADVHAVISVHKGKTQVWNRGGVVPQDIDIITAAAVRVPDAVVWRGPQELPAKQGLKVLGAPIGHPQYVQEFLRGKSKEQQVLFERTQFVNDPQAG